MVSPAPRGVPDLLDRIACEIRSSGPIPFSRFMEHALYDPELGYYARGSGRLGREGDYFTASDVGSAFGECAARQLREMDSILGRPAPFAVIEHGAGRGLLARDILDATARDDPGLSARLEVVLVDAGSGMRERARLEVPEATVVPPGGAGPRRAGCCLAVELFDALPVHRVRRRGGRIREVYVGMSEGGELIEVEDDPLPGALDLAVRYGAAPGEGDEAEVCPGAAAALDGMASSLSRGFLLVVDYGYPATELYAPSRRRGTLLAYHRHATNEDYLRRVGEQDLTAHVNFTHLEDLARERGLAVLGRTTQDRFLIANGILDRFADAPGERREDPARVRARLRAMQLIHPEGMGRTFRVLILSAGISPPPVLAGLVDPFALREPPRVGT